MHEEQEQPRLDEVLQQAAEVYHRPPPTPRRELWRELQQARAARRLARPSRRVPHPLVWLAGMAATLALGVGLGRWSAPPPATSAPTAAPAAAAAVSPPTNTAAYRITTAEYLEQAEVFLTLFRMSVQRGAVDSLAPATARPLLATNRLLLDSPASTDPKIRALLEDLELVLAQIAQLSPRPRQSDLDLITTGIERTAIMARLWTKMSSSPIGA